MLMELYLQNPLSKNKLNHLCLTQILNSYKNLLTKTNEGGSKN